MNIIKTTGIGIVLFMLCSLCTDPKYVPNQFSGEEKFLSVFASVSETEIPVTIAENHQIELFGNVTSCNLSQSGEPCISVSGVITQKDAVGNFNFESGELILESTITNCKLWGQFSGKGMVDGNRITISSDVEVTCGTGLFQANSGKLKMTITGLFPSVDHKTPIYELSLQGQLDI